ncbi:PDZ/DHR/GLGF domain protein [Trichuris suis]|nr:PDZ/DHR/GLGF domain protein [Trichuris suis]
MPGIYVKKVVPGSAAAKDGRLQAGDQLVAVNGQNLVGVTQEYAAKLMSQSGPVVNFEVAKGAALYNGLAQWIYQFSPEAGRSGASKGLSPAQGGRVGYGMPYAESPAASPMRFKKSAGVRSPSTSPSHLTSRSSVGLQQQPPARAAGTSTHRYSTSDIYHNVQNNRHVVQTVKQPPPAFYNRMYPAGSGGRSGRSMSASSLLHDAYMDGSHPLMRRDGGDPSVSPAAATTTSGDAYLRHREAEMPYTASRMPVHMGRAMTPPAIQVVDIHHQRSPSLMTPNRSPAGGIEPYGHEASQQYSRRPLPPESPHGYGGYGQSKLGNGGVVSGSPSQVMGSRTRAQVAVNDSLRPPEAAGMTRRHGGGMNATQTLPDKLPTGAASVTHYIDDLSSRRSPYFADSLRSTQATSGNDNVGPTDACLAGLDASDLGREEFSEQIETEMEKLMLDELYRLQLKPSLTPAEQRRYRAVRYELEFRRRMRSNSSGEHPVNQTHPTAAEQHETYQLVCRAFSERKKWIFRFASRPTASPGVTREGDYSVRQQQRDRYFEEAERQYQMMAAREWHSRQKQGMTHPETRLAVQEKSNVVTQAENGVASSVSEVTTNVDSQARSMHNGARAQAEEPPAAPVYERGQKVVASDEAAVQPPKAQVQFDSAPPAVYLVDQLSNNERFMDLVTSTSETNPVSGELENIIDATKLESPSPSSILIHHHKSEAKYVYQNADETPRTQVIGGQEVYKDPRQERLKQLKPVCQQVEGEKLSFRDKMRLFAKEFNEPSPKPPGVKSSSAQREIEMNLNVSR